MIAEMVTQTRQVEGYRPMPIAFNEDDHFDFDQPTNNFLWLLVRTLRGATLTIEKRTKASTRATRACL